MRKKKPDHTILIIAFACAAFFLSPLTGTHLPAQPSGIVPPPAPSAPGGAEAAPPAPSAPPMADGDEGPVKRGEVSFNFDDADIYEVIQTIFGEVLKVNYMIDPRVKGRVNFRTVTPVPRGDVLPIMEVLLKMNGAGFVKEKGIYMIVPSSEIPGTTPKIFVYPLQNSKSAHIATLLQQIFSGALPPPAGTRPVGSAPATPPPTGAATAPRPASSIIAVGGGALVSPETRVLADEITNSLIVLATPSDYTFIEGTVKRLDTIPRQVMIEALVASVTLTDNMRFGIQWSLDTAIKLSGLKPFDRGINIGGPLALNTPIDSPVFTYTAKDTAGRVRLLLQTLAEENKAKVLSSPHVLVSDNREARIQVGDQIPIATSQTTNVSTTPAQTTTTIQYKDTGTILKVKPQVNDSGLISLELSQEVSTVSTQTVLGTQQFVISKREVDTNLVVQNGQTIVIGGLISENTLKNRVGIPILNKIPILKYFFGSTVDDNTRTELIILLTPHVVRNQQEAESVSSGYLDRLKGTKKDLERGEFIKEKELKPQAPAPAPAAPPSPGAKSP